MGASALFTALNALPWEDEEDSSSSEDEEKTSRQASTPEGRGKASRPGGERFGQYRCTWVYRHTRNRKTQLGY